MDVTIVAEPGCTHEGSEPQMLALVDLAAQAGADAVKFQWVSDAERFAQRRQAGEFLPYYRWLQFTPGIHAALAARCAQRGLAYACTVYLPEDVAVVAPFTSFYKLAAFEAETTDLADAIVAAASSDGKPVVVSLGLGQTEASVRNACPSLNRLPGSEQVVWLHCVSAYPAPIGTLDLPRIRRERLDGLSDHTPAADRMAMNVGGWAVAAGARWIERHIRLESCPDRNPDAVVSLGGHQFDEYVERTRAAAAACEPHGVLSPSEERMRAYRSQPATQTDADQA